MSADRQKIAFEIPAGVAVVDGVAVIRYMDDDGDDCFRIVAHNNPGSIVELGLLRSAVILRESQRLEGLEDDR